MRKLEVLPEESYRIDRFIIRAYGTYDWRKVGILQFFNPQMDLLWFTAGIEVLVPNDREIKEMGNYKAYYELVRS